MVYIYDQAPADLKVAADYIDGDDIQEASDNGCFIQIAAIDLDNNGIAGMAIYKSGKYCCGNYTNCSFVLLENAGGTIAELLENTGDPSPGEYAEDVMKPGKGVTENKVDKKDIVLFTYDITGLNLNATSTPTKGLIGGGGSTPVELGKLLFKALKTNDKKLWLNCIRPNNNLYSDLSNAFDDFRNSLMEQGVEDWNLLTYSRTTFVADPNSDGYVQELHGEKTAHGFQVEYYYNGKEFIGAFHLAVIATYNNGNYFMAAAGGSHLQATLDRNSFK